MSPEAAAGRLGCESVTDQCFVRQRSRMECAYAKLPMDFSAHTRLRRDMDDDKRELLIRLCTRAGMEMEDASVVALTIGSLGDQEIDSSLGQLRKSAMRISTLIDAARSLN